MMQFKTNLPGIKPRIAALEVIKIVAAGGYAEIAIERIMKKYPVNSLDKSLIMELAYGSIRYRKLLDSWINHLGKVSASKQPPELRWILHLGLYQIIFMTAIPASAAVNTSVQIAKINKLENLAPVVNGLLRTALRMKVAKVDIPLPNDPAQRLSQEQSLPLWLIKNLFEWIGKEEAEVLSKSFNRVPTIDLRVNRLRTIPQKVIYSLEAEGIHTIPIENCPYGLEVKSGHGALKNWPGYKEGHWSVQDRSAQWVAPLLKPQPGERILDACAAPGGKATHLAELMDNIGEIWAIDRSSSRLKKIISNIHRLGTDCIQTIQSDSTNLINNQSNWEGYFHGILLDAPCSGLGTLARNPDARWRISPKKVSELINLQETLLEALLPLLSFGGRLVYSTCTIHPEENNIQIKKFIEKHPTIQLVEQKQIWPHSPQKGDGFYAAVMKLCQ